jgi:hypothetical protein
MAVLSAEEEGKGTEVDGDVSNLMVTLVALASAAF